MEGPRKRVCCEGGKVCHGWMERGEGAEKVGEDRERAEGKTCPIYGQGCVYGVDMGWGCQSPAKVIYLLH